MAVNHYSDKSYINRSKKKYPSKYEYFQQFGGITLVTVLETTRYIINLLQVTHTIARHLANITYVFFVTFKRVNIRLCIQQQGV